MTRDQIEFYAENGYLVIEDAIDAATLRGLRAVIAEFQEEAKHVAASDAVFDVGPSHSAATPELRRIKHPTRRHAAFDALMRSALLVDVAAALLGGTVRFDHAKLNFKPAGGNAGIAWHQDWAFYPHTNDDLLAIGVMVEDCTAENGPLMVIPGSHKGPLHDHHWGGVFTGAITENALGADLDRAVALTARAGSISIHHVRTLHASGENRSASTRPLLLFSYAAVDAFPIFAAPDLAEFDGRILRGEPRLTARVADVPVRLPLPKAAGADSIFDHQAALARVATQGRTIPEMSTG